MFDALGNIGTELVIKFFSVLALLAGTATGLVAIAVPILADWGLVLAAVFAPFSLAIYPISKTWSYNSLKVAIQSGLVSVGCSIFLQILLGDAGILQAAVNSTTARMSAEEGFLPVIGGMVGMTCIYALASLVLLSIPRIVQALFGGFALDGGAIAGAISSVASSASEAAGKVAGPAAGVAGRGIATAVASGASSIAKGMTGGAARSTMEQTARALNSIAGATPKAPASMPSVPQSGILRATPPGAAGLGSTPKA